MYESAETRRVGARKSPQTTSSISTNPAAPASNPPSSSPLPGAQRIEGVVEVLNKRAGEFTAEDAHFLEEASRLAGSALTNLEAIESERQTQLFTLERLTALYDLGRTFTSTLELGVLLPVVAGKIRDIMGAGARLVWLADPGSQDLYLAKKIGEDPTIEDGAPRPSYRRPARRNRPVRQSKIHRRPAGRTRPRRTHRSRRRI